MWGSLQSQRAAGVMHVAPTSSQCRGAEPNSTQRRGDGGQGMSTKPFESAACIAQRHSLQYLGTSITLGEVGQGSSLRTAELWVPVDAMILKGGDR